MHTPFPLVEKSRSISYELFEEKKPILIEYNIMEKSIIDYRKGNLQPSSAATR
jgi:hypothetical protein